MAPEGAFRCLPAQGAVGSVQSLRFAVLAAGDKIGFPASVSILPLLDQQLPAVVYPVAAGNAFTVAVMAHFSDLVAVPQVADIVLCLFTAFAGAPSERVIAVEPAFARRGVDNPELVTAVSAVGKVERAN
ncbi:hypothetical protein F157LOC_03224 [Pectobacterium brasiliense]|nr:hypothetical protein F157LOC_03224 [Pectobacterium brasiliense]